MSSTSETSYFEPAKLAEIAASVGTPTYCYSSERIVQNYRAYRDVFGRLDKAQVCFAVKANSNIEVLRLLAEEGCGADVVSQGELELALRAGIAPSKIVFSGVAKTQEEIQFALSAGIFQINVESEPELHAIAEVAARLNLTARVALRINPDIRVDTNAKIATGNAETKFGIPWHRVVSLIDMTKTTDSLHVAGIAVHLGSQIRTLEPYALAFDQLVELVQEIQENQGQIDTLDIGGGLGIDYHGTATDLPTPMDLADLVQQKLGLLGVKILVEPGRSLVGNAGVLLSKVIYAKQGEGRNFLIIDAGMNDLLRPSMYDAYHRISAVGPQAPDTEVTYDIVGPVCETGDIFAKDRTLPKLDSGDLVIIHDAGAYGAVMASTYNARPMVAEVLMKEAGFSRIDTAPLRRP